MTIEYEELEALRTQIEELRAKAQESGIDVSAEIRPLETQFDAVRKGEQQRTSRFDRVKLARNQGRPFTLDFIDFITDDWFDSPSYWLEKSNKDIVINTTDGLETISVPITEDSIHQKMYDIATEGPTTISTVGGSEVFNVPN